MKKLALLVLLVGCSQGPIIHHVGDTANCASACAHVGPQAQGGLGCPEGEPLEDGTSCTSFCEQTQNSGHALDPTCLMSVTSCGEIHSRCGE